MNAKRVLVATDVPFWRQSTGAQQRIFSLVRCLHNNKFCLQIFFIASQDTKDLKREIADQPQLAWLAGLLKFASSHDPPTGRVARLIWQLKGTWNLFFSRQQTSAAVFPTKLSDYDWPWARAAFRREVVQFQPDVVLVEYIKLAYLLNVTSEKSFLKILDSHDLLHQRYQRFADRGQKHWIEIDRATESAVFQQFDTIVAIQENEAQQIQAMATDCQVIVCTHACFPKGTDPGLVVNRHASQIERLRLGILASNNPANRSAITNFLANVWQNQFAKQSQLSLLIAGSVCDGIPIDQQTQPPDNVVWDPELTTTAAFYDHIDVVINPIEFGTGLKIKNVEAIAHGKPLITTPHGADGFIEAPVDGVFVADSPVEYQRAIDALLATGGLARLSAQAAALSGQKFSESVAYRPLLDILS